MNKTLKINSYYSPKYSDHYSGGVGFYHCGVYLHGEVERLCGYDICAPANPYDFDGAVHQLTAHFASGDRDLSYLFLDGVFPCIVDDIFECTAFLWYDKGALEAGYDNDFMHGLIVLNTDTNAMEYARRQYEERANSL